MRLIALVAIALAAVAQAEDKCTFTFGGNYYDLSSLKKDPM